jgi:hypothetical protein
MILLKQQKISALGSLTSASACHGCEGQKRVDSMPCNAIKSAHTQNQSRLHIDGSIRGYDHVLSCFVRCGGANFRNTPAMYGSYRILRVLWPGSLAE